MLLSQQPLPLSMGWNKWLEQEKQRLIPINNYLSYPDMRSYMVHNIYVDSLLTLIAVSHARLRQRRISLFCSPIQFDS